MKLFQETEYKYCSIRLATYKGEVYMPPHVDAQSKISIVLKGSLTEKVENQFIKAERNSIVIKPNNVLHENVYDSKGVSLLSIIFKGKDIPIGSQSWNWVEDARTSFQVYKLLFLIKAAGREKEMRKVMDDFFQTVKTIKKQEHKIKPAWLDNFLIQLKQYPIHNETVETIAERLKITRVHLSRSLKKHHAISPVQYRQYSRLNELMYLLTVSDKSLAEIAYECGFSDSCQMSRVVKKETGLTPQSLRLLLKNK